MIRNGSTLVTKGGGILDYLHPCQRIWKGYSKTYALGATVIRKGFEFCGESIPADVMIEIGAVVARRSTPEKKNRKPNFGDYFTYRGESDLEHQAKVAYLASVFKSNFPDFFGEDLVHQDFSRSDWDALVVALCHDTGEVKNGDQVDDGSPGHEVKDAAELEVFEEFVQSYAEADRERLIEVYKSFQKRDSRPMQALYALDKLEAALTQLLLEKYGVRGCATVKPNPTEQDLRYAKEAGSIYSADGWSYGLMDRLNGFPPEITEPVFTLLEVAVRDVRKESFFWLPK